MGRTTLARLKEYRSADMKVSSLILCYGSVQAMYYRTKNLQDCQTICDRTDDCHVWSWISGNRVCALKYGHHQYAMQRAQGTYTGVKNGNGHYLRDEMAVLND